MQELTQEEKQLLFTAMQNHFYVLEVCAKKINKEKYENEVEKAKNLLNKLNNIFKISNNDMMIGLNTFSEEKPKLNKLILTEELEAKSRYGIPHTKALIWFWKDELGNIGWLHAITEMEALDRLREAFEEVGRITWLTEKAYQELI